MELSNSMNDDQVKMYSSSDEQEAVDRVAVAGEEEEEHEEHRLGVGRWYECVFCRRGFNTAQALGGHMNIHRKDRARNNNFDNKPNAAADDHKKKQLEDNYYYYYYHLWQQQQIPRCSSVHLPAPDHDHHEEEEAVQFRYSNNNNNCQQISSVSSSSSGDGAGFFCGNRHSQLLGGERITNTPPFASSTGFVGEIRKEELDLELRL